jgi:hypothetical protein
MLVFIIATLGLTSGQNAQPPFTITLTAPKNPLKIGSKIRVDIMLKNTSNTDISVSKSNAEDQAEFSYVIDVRDEKDEPPPKTEYARSLNGEDANDPKHIKVVVSSDVISTLKPGETLNDIAVLNRLYDLSRPGKYVVQIGRQIPKELGRGFVKSNAVTLTVTQ